MFWGPQAPLKMFTQFTHFQFTQMDAAGVWDDITSLTDITGYHRHHKMTQDSYPHQETAPIPICQNDQNIH